MSGYSLKKETPMVHQKRAARKDSGISGSVFPVQGSESETHSLAHEHPIHTDINVLKRR
jgi:hypothetical protein